jgi:TATA-binding protein-associated factor Taf7
LGKRKKVDKWREKKDEDEDDDEKEEERKKDEKEASRKKTRRLEGEVSQQEIRIREKKIQKEGMNGVN